MYKLLKTGIGGTCITIVRDNDDGTKTSFLENPANTDYQAYLAWVSEGNVAEPADQQGEQV